MRDDTRASLQLAAVLDASRPSEAGVDAGSGAISKSMDVRTGGAVAWTQADFKVSFYPGAVVDAERCQQLRLGATYSSTVVHSTSDSMRVVRAFYRKKLRESANGIAVVETSDGDSVTMVAKRGETDITMIVVERDPELGVVEITQQQLGEASAR